MNIDHIIRFEKSLAQAEEYYLPEEKLIAGNPKQTVWQHYTDRSEKFLAGEWHSEIGKWHISYTEEEYCRILQGRSVIADLDGNAIALAPGDSFVIPGGFKGTWEVLEPTRKIYVIYEA